MIGSTVVTTGSLTGVGISASAVSYTEEISASGFKYEQYGETITITGYNGSDTELVIPSEIDGKTVTRIKQFAFYDCTVLTSVTIPNSVTEIGGGAFGRCTGLTNITIPDSVTEIGSGAFDYCTRLTSITISSDNTNYSSQDGVWFNKDKTKLIQYPCGKTGIYTIPDSVTSIGSGAFEDCKGLTSVTIPDSVISIGYMAFSDCTGITSITIPDSVTEIGDYAFGYYWYYYDDDDPGSGFSDYTLIDDFTIYGVKGSAAEIYADKNWITFVAVEPEYTKGDVTGEGDVNIADALLIARYDASLEVLDETQQKAGDVTGEGEVNIADALLIARYDAGLIDTL